MSTYAISGSLMVFQKVLLKVCIPVLKRSFGDDERKVWSFAMPAFLVALGLAPCLLLIGTDMATWDFWLLLVMQEVNSVAKNTGKCEALCVAVGCRRAVPPSGRRGNAREKKSEERRSTIAPCGSIGEIVSPVVLMITIGLDSTFDWLPFERAPYFSDSGILGGWRKQRFRGGALVMLTIILFNRMAFCWIEVEVRPYYLLIWPGRCLKTVAVRVAKVRAHPHRYNTDTSATEPSSEDPASDAARTRRSSMAGLYHRIVRPDNDVVPVQMKYLASAFLLLQSILFVEYTSLMEGDCDTARLPCVCAARMHGPGFRVCARPPTTYY